MWKLIVAIGSSIASGIGLFVASRDWGREDQRKKDEMAINESNETAAAATDILNMAQESDDSVEE